MNFCSDNTTGISPQILAAISEANQGNAMPYGADEYTQEAEKHLASLFETDATVYLIGTGTAANSLALSTVTPPYGAVLCHKDSHIAYDETGAPEFYTGGAKLIGLEGDYGKITPKRIEAAVANNRGSVHQVLPSAVSLTQSTEFGAVYSREKIKAICDMAHSHNMKVHMDGARFANAVASTGASPAELTWKQGVDVLTFGATKNGAMGAESVIFFDKILAEQFGRRRKRGGQLFSKMRFIAAQWNAYLTDNLWLNNARHANAMATKLSQGLAAIESCQVTSPVEANEIFVVMPTPIHKALTDKGFNFYQWPGDNKDLYRLVTAFDSKEEDIDSFILTAKAAA